MKIKLIYIAAAILLAAAVSITSVLLLDVAISVHLKAKEKSVSNDAQAIEFTIKNNTLRMVYFGAFFQLEKWNADSGTWDIYDDKPDEPKLFDMWLGEALPLSPKEIYYSLWMYSDHFENGLYRIVQVVSYGKPYGSKDITLYGEFTIT